MRKIANDVATVNDFLKAQAQDWVCDKQLAY